MARNNNDEASVWDGEALANHPHDRWVTSDNTTFYPSSITTSKMPPGMYRVRFNMSMGLPFFEKLRINTEDLIQFPGTNSETIIGEIKDFWERKNIFKEYEIAYKRGILLYGPPGCHPKGTKVVMFDGSLKNIEDIKVGDKLIGPDSKPRTVLELCRGIDEMYEITPVKGETFVVNGNHILNLKRSRKSDKNYPPFLNIKVKDFINLSKPVQKSIYKLRHSECIDFNNNDHLELDPYFLGLWLGDGTESKAEITTVDPEIEKEIYNFANENNLKVKKYGREIQFTFTGDGSVEGKFKNTLLNKLNCLKLLNNKHIPEDYLVSSIESRLKLLAGIIDTDGGYSEVSWRPSDLLNKKGYKGYYEVTQKRKKLAEDIVRLARSLGFACTIKPVTKTLKSRSFSGTYYRINIFGDINRIPVKISRKKAQQGNPNKDPLVTGIKSVKKIGEDNYYGFVLNKDHLYITEDFIVHHNSGKSCIIRLVVSDLVKERQGVCLVMGDPDTFMAGLRKFREVQPETPVVILLEDIDSILMRYNESDVLNILDGLENIDNTVFLACHSPETRLLTKDLKWVPAGEIKAGDKLWGFDENRSEIKTKTGRETARRYKESTVVSSFRAKKECVRVHLDTGESFVCTKDHPWLSFGSKTRSGNNLEWTLAEELLIRPNLVRPFIPWETDLSWEAGWFAGILDGEGFLRKGREGNTTGVGVVQTLGNTANEIERLANKYGSFKCDIKDPGNSHKKQMRLRSVDGVSGAASILGTVRPIRLLENFDISGAIVQSKYKAKVIKIEDIGLQEIQSIETTSKTYFAEGFAVHNTTNYPKRLGARIINRPSRFDKRFLVDFPTIEAREIYLKHLASKGSININVKKWAKDTDKFTFAHLKELFTAVVILDNAYDMSLENLRKMREIPDNPEEFDEPQEVDDGSEESENPDTPEEIIQMAKVMTTLMKKAVSAKDKHEDKVC